MLFRVKAPLDGWQSCCHCMASVVGGQLYRQMADGRAVHAECAVKRLDALVAGEGWSIDTVVLRDQARDELRAWRQRQGLGTA